MCGLSDRWSNGGEIETLNLREWERVDGKIREGDGEMVIIGDWLVVDLMMMRIRMRHTSEFNWEISM